MTSRNLLRSATWCGRLVRTTQASRQPVLLHRLVNPAAQRGFASASNEEDSWTEAERREEARTEQERLNRDEEDAIKERILTASLSHVVEHGWTRMAITAGAEAEGYISIVSGLFPGEGADLLLHHVRQSNRALDQWMEEEVVRYREEAVGGGQGKVPVGKFIREAVEKRLMMNSVFIEADRWGEAMAILTHPKNGFEGVRCMQELCDDIWFRAGDNSSDLNWYSKRISLAAIFATTETFMLQDKSQDFQETMQFLDRRFADLQSLPQLATLPEDVGGLLSGLAVTARNMAGLQK